MKIIINNEEKKNVWKESLTKRIELLFYSLTSSISIVFFFIVYYYCKRACTSLIEYNKNHHNALFNDLLYLLFFHPIYYFFLFIFNSQLEINAWKGPLLSQKSKLMMNERSTYTKQTEFYLKPDWKKKSWAIIHCT